MRATAELTVRSKHNENITNLCFVHIHRVAGSTRLLCLFVRPGKNVLLTAVILSEDGELKANLVVPAQRTK